MSILTASLATVMLVSAPQATQDVLAFADAFDRAQLAQDVAALDEMVADTLVFIDSSGKRQDKKAFIAGWLAPGDRFDPVVLADRVVVRLGPDAAVVSAEATLSGTSGGKRFSSRFRFADTFVRTGGKWRATYIQVTPIR